MLVHALGEQISLLHVSYAQKTPNLTKSVPICVRIKTALIEKSNPIHDIFGNFSMISQKAKYALRALLALARADGNCPVQISDIARTQAIPKKFLEQILLELKRAEIVTSRRGKQGGYLLQRPATEISFGEVLRLIDGPVAPLPCLSQTAYRRCEDCDGETQCEIRHVFAQVADATRNILFNTTIADAISGADVAELLTA